MSAAQRGPHECDVCGSVSPARTGRGRGRRYCSRACQQTAYRARRTPPTDPQARLNDLRSAVHACYAALQQGDMAATADAADAVARAARVLARTARQSITTEAVTPSHQRQAAPSTPSQSGSRPLTRTTPEPETEPPTASRTVTPVPVTQIQTTPTETASLPRRPVLDLGDGYELQPPSDRASTRWSLLHHGQHIGHIERTHTPTGRTPRWRAHSPTGRPITATTAARDGTYRTKRDALVQVALDHQLQRPPATARHARPPGKRHTETP